ncbi:hypothetical protein [Clostridium sp.]|jgi:hypothetical protein|uniref:hypothetical protein n=1 Tax=Clostridium sp. TaxID=1506 RepID=UPI003EEF6786
MEKRAVNKIIINLFTTLQVFLLTIPIVLQYISDKKMGVNRYLVFKKMILSKDELVIKLVLMLKVVLILGLIIGIVLLICYFIKKSNILLVKSIIKIIILNSIGICFTFLDEFEGLLTYHFFLTAIFLIIVLQCLKLILNLTNITRKIS